MTPCAIDGCERPQRCRGWCVMHYGRWQTHGNPLTTAYDPPPPLPSLVTRDGVWAGDLPVRGGHERVAARVLSYLRPTTDGCWTHTSPSVSGYAHVFAPPGSTLAHRRLYIALVRDLTADEPLDHLCRNRACCNPAHLEPVDARTNSLRGIGVPAFNARKTHCKHGHEFTPDNTYIHPKRGTRNCRACYHDNYLKRRDAGAPRRVERSSAAAG